jgi:hypothetical protein
MAWAQPEYSDAFFNTHLAQRNRGGDHQMKKFGGQYSAMNGARAELRGVLPC